MPICHIWLFWAINKLDIECFLESKARKALLLTYRNANPPKQIQQPSIKIGFKFLGRTTRSIYHKVVAYNHLAL
jgi:hypothetical protein